MTDSTQRLLEAKSLIDACEDPKLIKDNKYDERIIMGCVYVLLYGAVEFTLTECVRRTIELLNSEKNLRLYHVLPSLWALIYNKECMSIETAGSHKKWEHRYDLFNKLTKNEIVRQIENNLFPSSNGNIKKTQIKRVWDTFGLKSKMFEDGHEYVQGYLVTLAEGRMAIAHGREKSSAVGRNKSINELRELYDSISRYCSYVIECFDQYMNKKEYLQ